MRTEKPPHIPEVIWQPLSMLPAIAELIQGSYSDATNLHTLLEEGKSRPYSLNDHIVNRAREQTLEGSDFVWVYTEQIHRWREQGPSADQIKEMDELEKVLAAWRDRIEELLDLLDVLQELTIEKLLEKSDFEVGLEALLGKLHRR